MRARHAPGHLPLLAVASALLLLGSAPARSAEPPAPPAAAPEAVVRLRDHRLYLVRVPSAGKTAEQR
ncbi:MAG TPA: hypothetical protein VK454_05975, partial [Myxococcaceae bacterium]|nr:hypothetical protein [Myxococcaceae bacterium]